MLDRCCTNDILFQIFVMLCVEFISFDELNFLLKYDVNFKIVSKYVYMFLYINSVCNFSVINIVYT